METESLETDSLSTVGETAIESELESELEEKTLDIKIIGDGDVRIIDAYGEVTKLGYDAETDQWTKGYPLGSEITVDASVKDETSFIYAFYIKNDNGALQKEQITGKGAEYKSTYVLNDNIQMLVVFAKVDEKEIVFDNPLDMERSYGVQTLALGDIGQNWGMYNLFTAYTIVPELGPNATYAYGHIIQVDSNGDMIYEDSTHTAYCIEYGIECPSGGYLTEEDLTVSQKDMIGYALAYGWRQQDTNYNDDLYKDVYARSEMAVTQGIIWCCTKGIFNTDSGESAMDTIINATYEPNHARDYYLQLKNKILNVDIKPSFNGKTLTLEWNEKNKRYETKVTDTNGVLEYFDYVYSGVTFSRKGNTLTIYTKNEYPEEIKVKAKREIIGGEKSVKTWNGWNGKQDMATYTENSREVTSMIRIKTKTKGGTLKLSKVSTKPHVTNENSYYSLENAVYGIYSDKECTKLVDKMTTDVSGSSNSVSLSEGDYYIKEISASKGYLLDSETYLVTVSSGKETLLEVKEVPMVGKIILTKTIHHEDINFDNGNPMFIFKLIGTCSDGKEHILYQIVDFTKDYVLANTDEHGDVHLTITFDDLPAGTYVAYELTTSRYTLEKITNIVNGVLNESKVEFTLDTVKSMEGEAEFINDNYEQQNYSDSAKVINEIRFQ